MRMGYEAPTHLRSCIRTIIEKAHVDLSMSQLTIEDRIRPYIGDLVAEVFRQFAATCRQRAVHGCIVYRPDVMELIRLPSASRQEVLASARSSGLAVLDLCSAFRGVGDRDSLVIVPGDNSRLPGTKREGRDDHPNALGHRLLADELYKLLHTDEGRELLKPVKKYPPADAPGS
jgi:hypothetical protein